MSKLDRFKIFAGNMLVLVGVAFLVWLTWEMTQVVSVGGDVYGG